MSLVFSVTIRHISDNSAFEVKRVRKKYIAPGCTVVFALLRKKYENLRIDNKY